MVRTKLLTRDNRYFHAMFQVQNGESWSHGSKHEDVKCGSEEDVDHVSDGTLVLSSFSVGEEISWGFLEWLGVCIVCSLRERFLRECCLVLCQECIEDY